ncbi:hypothetical protein [Salmonella enterica]|uniref:hypothetical protein n=1 Tax=Salmonella enterica TaxID=28901 RepID=UPI0012FDA09E|nr:hypothetical protein [Salmonella enterica]
MYELIAGLQMVALSMCSYQLRSILCSLQAGMNEVIKAARGVSDATGFIFSSHFPRC